MIENLLEIKNEDIEQNVQKMFDEGYRFITITCVDAKDEFDIIYHFDKEYHMQHFRTKISKDQELESISKIYFCAMLVENEIMDLFGIKVKNIAVDYDGRLLLSDGAPHAPMCNKGQIEIEVRGGSDGK